MKVWQKTFWGQVQSKKLTALFIIIGNFRSQNWNQWDKLSTKNTHIYFFYFWFKSKQVWTSLDEFGRKKSKVPKLQKITLTTIFITVFQYIMCKHAQKRSFMTNLMKRQIHPYEATFLFFILDHFWLQNWNHWKKPSRKTPPYYCFYVWFKNKQVWTSLDEKNRNLTKKLKVAKSLRIFF